MNFILLLDHGSTAAAAGSARDALAVKLAAQLPADSRVIPCSLKPPGAPTLAETLERPELAGAKIEIIPLFIFPGRHAGAGGDIEQIADASARRHSQQIRIAPLFTAHPDFPALLASLLQPA
jgi:sirohydrochlorin ferrochelatase